MSPKFCLLLLALTLGLAPHAHCQKDESSGDAEEAPLLSEEVQVSTQSITVTEITKTNAQVVSERTPTSARATNTTQATKLSTTSGVKTVKGTSGNKDSRIVKVKKEEVEEEVEEEEEEEKKTTPSSQPKEEKVEEEESYMFIIIAVCLVLLLLITVLSVAGVMIRRRRRRIRSGADGVKEDPYLTAGDGEKVPMPMFEDDVQSVIEVEMEDLEKWMVKGDGGIGADLKQKQFL